MAGPRLLDHIWQTSTTSGSGTYTLTTARSGFRTFADAETASQLSDGDTVFYAVHDIANGGYESGIGTIGSSGTTLARTTVIVSSNSNAAVSWATGTREVVCSFPGGTIATAGVPLIGNGTSGAPLFQATGVKIDSHFGTITADTDASTVTMDLSVSDWHSLLTTSGVGGNRTLAVSNPTTGQQFAVIIQQAASGGPYTVTWFSGILWSGGTVPTLTTTASKRDVFGFKCIASNVYLGFVMGQNF